jgi:hypothetical protein
VVLWTGVAGFFFACAKQLNERAEINRNRENLFIIIFWIAKSKETDRSAIALTGLIAGLTFSLFLERYFYSGCTTGGRRQQGSRNSPILRSPMK